jgi:RimJ/RimL family protein N-acetyltransferase
MSKNSVQLRRAHAHEAESLWQQTYSDLTWKNFDAPYFAFTPPTLDEYKNGSFARLLAGKDAMAVEVNSQIVGQVSSYWENEATRWLEAGIVLFGTGTWGRGVGRAALTLWINQLFAQHDVGRIGLTTWSGNPRMIRCAKAIGFTLEGTLRRCRFYNGVYYDAIRLGVLREEWAALCALSLEPPNA